MSSPTLDFTSAYERKIEALKVENESLRAELQQMRLVVLQLKAPSLNASSSSPGEDRNAKMVDTRGSNPSAAAAAAAMDGKSKAIISSDGTTTTTATQFTKRGILGGKARKERVKVAFNLLACRHAMERLRNTVGEVRATMTSDYGDALRMLAERRRQVEERIAWERPLVHRIHEGICELVRHGGNQRAETLQQLFSATSWGVTKMSLVQASDDIVRELSNLCAVAEQQRRAKEVLECVALHKDKCLERANRALFEMAKTSRDVVATFARMAREVHGLAAQAGEDVSHVKSLLVTRALTVPDLDAFVQASNSKSPELSTAAIEKFARHLQDAAFASTALLSSATKAVLEPETIKMPAHEGDGDDDDDAVGGRNSKTSRKSKAAIDKNESDDDAAHPGLVKRLRQRWVKSVFLRAMLRMRFAKCLGTIHDDFLQQQLQQQQQSASAAPASTARQKSVAPHPPASAALFTRTAPPPPVAVPAAGSASSASDAQHLARWSSSTKPPNKTGSLRNEDDDADNKDGVVANNNNAQPSSTTAIAVAPWTSEDDRRLQLHARRHRTRVTQVLGVAHPDAVARTVDLHLQSQQQNGMPTVFSGIDRAPPPPPRFNSLSNGSAVHIAGNNAAHQRSTVTSSRRVAAPGGLSSSFLGKMPPLTGSVEVNNGGGSNTNANTSTAAIGDALGVVPAARGRRAVGDRQLFAPATESSKHKGRAAAVTGDRPAALFGATPIHSALQEFFVLRSDH